MQIIIKQETSNYSVETKNWGLMIRNIDKKTLIDKISDLKSNSCIAKFRLLLDSTDKIFLKRKICLEKPTYRQLI